LGVVSIYQRLGILGDRYTQRPADTSLIKLGENTSAINTLQSTFLI